MTTSLTIIQRPLRALPLPRHLRLDILDREFVVNWIKFRETSSSWQIRLICESWRIGFSPKLEFHPSLRCLQLGTCAPRRTGCHVMSLGLFGTTASPYDSPPLSSFQLVRTVLKNELKALLPFCCHYDATLLALASWILHVLTIDSES
jgi:hypothetical protein